MRLSLTVLGKVKKTRIAKIVFQKKNKLKGISLLDFRGLHSHSYHVCGISRRIDTYINGTKTIENPEIHPHK